MKPSPEDIRIGKMAALDDLIATCETDVGHFRRDDLSIEQNDVMQAELESLWFELSQRRINLVCRKNPQQPRPA